MNIYRSNCHIFILMLFTNRRQQYNPKPVIALLKKISYGFYYKQEPRNQ